MSTDGDEILDNLDVRCDGPNCGQDMTLKELVDNKWVCINPACRHLLQAEVVVKDVRHDDGERCAACARLKAAVADDEGYDSDADKEERYRYRAGDAGTADPAGLLAIAVVGLLVVAWMRGRVRS